MSHVGVHRLGCQGTRLGRRSCYHVWFPLELCKLHSYGILGVLLVSSSLLVIVELFLFKSVLGASTLILFYLLDWLPSPHGKNCSHGCKRCATNFFWYDVLCFSVLSRPKLQSKKKNRMSSENLPWLHLYPNVQFKYVQNLILGCFKWGLDITL